VESDVLACCADRRGRMPTDMLVTLVQRSLALVYLTSLCDPAAEHLCCEFSVDIPRWHMMYVAL